MSLFFAPSRKLAAARLEHGGSRVYDPRERLLLAGFDQALRAASLVLGRRPRGDGAPAPEVEHILCLRLDRLGDLVMTLPALESLRRAAPRARIELGVGSWNEPIARRLPFVDAVQIIDAPWAAWGKAASLSDARRAMRASRPDLVIDFQGDIRVLALMSETRAPLRAGYADTGGAYLLTHRAKWDETKSWYWQNDALVHSIFPDAETGRPPYNFVTDLDRAEARSHLASLRDERPLIGIHPSAGRAIKEWEPEKFAALIDRLAPTATIVLTGAPSDRALVERIEGLARTSPATLIGVELMTFAAVVEALDVFVTGDTGPMHLSHAVGTQNVAVFGPSDPARYGPPDALGLHTVVRTPVYCSPCNMIRRPPSECARAAAPECISGITLDQMESAVRTALATVNDRVDPSTNGSRPP